MDYYKKVLSSSNSVPEDRGIYQSTEYWMLVSFLLHHFSIKNYFGDSNKKVANLTYPFISWIDSYDFSSWNLIEFGSGDSTIHFSNKFKTVYSYETNKQYADYISSLNLPNVNISVLSKSNLEQLSFALSVNDNTLIIVDSACNRLKVVKNLTTKFNPNIIVLDNSDNYPNTSNMLSQIGYTEIPFWGLRAKEQFESCTSVFVKDVKLFPRRKWFKTSDHRTITNNLWDKNI
jgi:hypothetical protein